MTGRFRRRAGRARPGRHLGECTPHVVWPRTWTSQVGAFVRSRIAAAKAQPTSDQSDGRASNSGAPNENQIVMYRIVSRIVVFRMRVIAVATAAVCAAVLMSSCDARGLTGSVEVRVENQSSLTMSAVEFYAGDSLATFSILEPGQSTPYVESAGAYGYTTVQVVVEGDTLRQQVIDYVGETPLGAGRYTYVLSVDGPAGNRNLIQTLREDS